MDTNGIVYFVEKASDGSASRLRKVKDGQLTTVTSVPSPGRIDGLALDYDSLLFLSVAPASGGGVTSTVYLGWVDPVTNAVTLLASLDLGASYASGLAKDPASDTIYYADPGLCVIMAGGIMAGVFGGQAPTPVAGTQGAGCGDNRHQNPAPNDPANNTDPAVGPALGTNVQLDLPYDVAFQPISMGGGLLFITDVGNRRVLALNTAGVALGVGQRTLPPAMVITLAGTESSTSPSGVVGNPPSTLGLCGPSAAAMVAGVLAFSDNCSPPSPTKGTILLVDFALGGASHGWTSLLGHDYHDAGMTGEFLSASPSQGLDSLMLSGSLGLARGGPSNSLFVTDFVNRGVYEVASPPLPAGMPVFTSMSWDPVAAPQLATAAERTPVFSVPAPPEYVELQRAYFQVKAQKVQEWRAAGLTDAQIRVLVADLKDQMLGE
ncbi:MAG: hypothetical protein HY906_04360 [Deltaproteobacteria bacterium]|nr:hypothetical protein [Deltaproteobacteria bacterium]